MTELLVWSPCCATDMEATRDRWPTPPLAVQTSQNQLLPKLLIPSVPQLPDPHSFPWVEEIALGSTLGCLQRTFRNLRKKISAFQKLTSSTPRGAHRASALLFYCHPNNFICSGEIKAPLTSGKVRGWSEGDGLGTSWPLQALVLLSRPSSILLRNFPNWGTVCSARDCRRRRSLAGGGMSGKLPGKALSNELQANWSAKCPPACRQEQCWGAS